MKATKKLLALILAVCMLIGMPLSVNVSAFGTADTDAPAVKAIPMPDHIAEKLGVALDRGILLYFNKDVTIAEGITNLKATAGSVSTGSGNEMSVPTTYWSDGVTSYSLRSDAQPIQQAEGFYYVVLPEATSVSELYTIHNKVNSTYYGLVVRLVDVADTVQDRTIDAITYGDGQAWPASDKTNDYVAADCLVSESDTASNVYEYLDVPLEDALTLDWAQWVDDTSVAVTFSQAWKVRHHSRYDAYIGVRLVNAEGKVMYYNNGTYSDTYTEGAEKLESSTWPVSETKATQTVTLSEKDANGDVKSMSWFMSHQASCPETTTINFVVEAKEQAGDKYFFPARGEAANNWLISGVCATTSGMPLIATHSGDGDAAMVEIDEMGSSIVLEQVTIKTQSNNTTSWNELVLEFSEPVKIDSGHGGRICLAIVKNGRRTAGSATVASWVSPSANGTSATWTIRLNTTSLADFITTNYTAAAVNQGAQLCFYTFDNGGDAYKGDGVIEGITSADGTKKLHSNGFHDDAGREAVYMPIGGFTPTVYLADDSTILFSSQGLGGVAAVRDNAYLRAYDNAGNALTVNEAVAQWKLEAKKWYTTPSNGQTQNVSASLAITENLGVSTYSAIVEFLNNNFPAGYNLELVVEDTTKDGIVDGVSKYDFTKWRYVDALLATPKYSTTEKDVVAIPFGEMVAIESVDVNGDDTAIITFSHDIDIEALKSVHTDFYDFYLTIWDNDLTSTDRIAAGTQEQTQVAMGNIERYGNSNNKILLRYDGDAYAYMMDYYNAGLDNGSNWEIRMRIEMETDYVTNIGKLPLNNNIKATTEGILSPWTSNFWGSAPVTGRTWSDVNIINNVIKVDDEYYTDIMEGLIAAGEGSTLTLLNDATFAGVFTLPSGATLDLNGKTLTVEDNATLIATLGFVKDSHNGSGLIKMSQGDVSNNTATVMLNPANGYLPLYDNGDEAQGYRLFVGSFESKGSRPGDIGQTTENATPDVHRFGVSLQFTNSRAYELLSAYGADCGIMISMNINTAGKVFGEEGLNAYFADDLLKDYANKCLDAMASEEDEDEVTTKTFVLCVKGMEEFRTEHPGEELIVNAKFISDFNVERQHTIPENNE